MAKSSRASTRKANNQRLKKNVFGPIESERAQRLSAKLLELASQPKPVKEAEMVDIAEVDDSAETAQKAQKDNEDEDMEIDSASKGKASTGSKPGKKRIEKRRVKKSSIVFPKYKDRRGQKKSK